MFSIIVAFSGNHVIGNNGEIPWNLPSDLKRFKNLTFGHTVVMGRRTHESISCTLPGRNKIVLSKEKYVADDCTVVNSLKELLQYLQDNPNDELFVIGGSQIYKLLLPLTQKLYVTTVHVICKGDSFFPKINFEEWERVHLSYQEKNTSDEYCSAFSVHERKRSPEKDYSLEYTKIAA